MKRRASVQDVHGFLEAIDDGVVRLSDGQSRAVLEVGSVNFALRGEVEREAIVAGFSAFLNGLTFPIQIVVRVLAVDVARYLDDLEARAGQLPGSLAELARDHAAFVRRLSRNRTLLERRFYLVVPGPIETPVQRWPFGRSRRHAADPAEVRRQLTARCDEVQRQLGRCGLAARHLGTLELAQLYHDWWCPELARLQRLQRELADYTTLVVQRKTHPERRS
ncbi:MAG TPA: hypothetical protein VNF73_12155 [Candidatus Saccharimonadales bacterium]|nr:hypothetical protein [Candidatus Saccharimonadales bacterium]